MSKKKDTLLTTLGRAKEFTHGVVNPPVYHASTVLFESYEQLSERLNVRDMDEKLFYGRMGTPTTRALEAAMAGLESGAGARLFPSGVAAVMTSLLAVLSAGDHLLITDNCYGPIARYAKSFLKRLGIETEFFDPMVGSKIDSLFKPNTRAVLVESPGSLTFEVQDIPAIAEVAHARDAFVIADNTWATAYFYNAIDHGADLSVNAATKYIVGHADAMMGVVVANERALPLLKRARFNLGQIVGPDDAYLTLRGLRTLGVRLERHQENGLKVAHWLNDHPLVHEVRHPAFENCPGHDIWKRDFSGASGLFSIILNSGELANMGAMIDDMAHFGIGLSWGGFESLIYPNDPAPGRRTSPWQAPGPLIRLHIGLEDPDDLIEDLDAALYRFKATL
jgi:cysteine-S-conjugate beta-lyase